MYEIDQFDRVIPLSGVPRPDIGTPLPVVVSDEQHLLLAYIALQRDPAWDELETRVVSPESLGLPVVIVDFRRPSAHLFGPPNDEAFAGHPLASHGLSPYAVFEIESSSWIRGYERMNSVHPMHNRERFLAARKHFIFAFHDSVFECIAGGFETTLIRGSIREARVGMLDMMADGRT